MSAEELEAAYNTFKALETEMAKMVNSRQGFVAQLNENDIVREELDLVNEGEKVFKRIGPVMVPQDLDDAKANVKKRLEFIQAELQKLEKNIQEKEQKKFAARDAVMKLQAEQQQRKAAVEAQ